MVLTLHTRASQFTVMGELTGIPRVVMQINLQFHSILTTKRKKARLTKYRPAEITFCHLRKGNCSVNRSWD
jgi:hypothetical protein